MMPHSSNGGNKNFNTHPNIMIAIKRTQSTDSDFKLLVKELDAGLRITNGQMMDIYDQHNIIDSVDTVVIAYLDETPVACGCFKPFDSNAVEIKRMFVRPVARGKGISAIVLHELENWAKSLSFGYTVLETGSRQVEALGLYKKSGYVPIPKYGPYVDLPDSICLRKQL
jgi:putative acetyltransferase